MESTKVVELSHDDMVKLKCNEPIEVDGLEIRCSNEKTVLSCSSEDFECMKSIKDGLNFLTGHNLIGVAASGYYYRGYTFEIKLTEKFKKG